MIFKFYVFFFIFALIMLIFSIISKNKNLKNRLLTLIVLLHVVCGILWLGTIATLIFVLLLLITSAKEFYFVSEISLFFPLLGFLLAGAGFYFKDGLSPLALMILTIIFAGMGFLLVLTEPKAFVKKLLILLSPVFYIPFGLFCLALLVEKNLGHFITLIVLTQFSDIFAYMGGKRFGKHKILPKISPNKTLEGFISSFFGVVAALVFLKLYLVSIPFAWTIVFGICLPLFFIFANIGDLVFSRLKRLMEVKNFGSLLPGHGGMLDRIDNIIFCSPLLLAILNVYHR